MSERHRREWIYKLCTYGAIVGLFAFFLQVQNQADEYQIRILNVSAIFVTLAVSYNLINGVAGQFSLGPNAFMAVGAYTTALLTLSPAEKELSFIIEPIIWPLSVLHLPFLPSLLIGGAFAALLGFIMAFPVFRVRGDYLAIVTLGFGEVIRVVANNVQSITNGPLGLKGLSEYTNLWWSWGVAVFTVFCVTRLVKSSFGRAMQAIREDEVAAAAMGINVFRHKMLAFVVHAFFAGMAGGLMAHLITTISPTLFSFFLTFNLLVIIVIGGLGSMTGSIIAAIIITHAGEWLRAVEEPMAIGPFNIPGIPGMRMVVFSIMLILVMIFARQGLMGRREFSWKWFCGFLKIGKRKG